VNVDALDRRRILRAWTQRELATAARVDPGTLGDLLAGRRRPNLGTLRAVCVALDLPFEVAIVFPARGPQDHPPAVPAPAELNHDPTARGVRPTA
jgi:transcriptional regulator with XRE-family HTH domain